MKLVNYFEANPKVGGLCGEIEAECVPGSFFESFIQAAQYYEYKSAYSPEKPCESLFGWTTALPGAYSMLRLKAIVGTPLDILFKNTSRSAQVMSCSEANEYLTEDRILCLQLYIKQETGYLVQYIPDAKAFCDVPVTLAMLIKQRRRWINGTFFCTLRVLTNVASMVSCRRND